MQAHLEAQSSERSQCTCLRVNLKKCMVYIYIYVGYKSVGVAHATPHCPTMHSKLVRVSCDVRGSPTVGYRNSPCRRLFPPIPSIWAPLPSPIPSHSPLHRHVTHHIEHAHRQRHASIYGASCKTIGP